MRSCHDECFDQKKTNEEACLAQCVADGRKVFLVLKEECDAMIEVNKRELQAS